MTSKTMRDSRHVALYLWLIILVIGSVCVGLFLVHFRYHAWDFRNNLWGPARLLLQGEMPYDPQALEGLSAEWGVPFHLSIWFPTIVGLGLPLGAVPLPNAANIWLFLSLTASLVTVGLVHRVSGPDDSPRILLSLALGAPASPVFQSANWLWFTAFVGLNLAPTSLGWLAVGLAVGGGR